MINFYVYILRVGRGAVKEADLLDIVEEGKVVHVGELEDGAKLKKKSQYYCT